MSKHTKRARRLLEKLAREQRRAGLPDIAALKEAAHYYWMGNIARCATVFFPLMDKLIVEPLYDSEEYKDGQRKPVLSVEEQEQEEETEPHDLTVTFEHLFGADTESLTDARTTEDPRDEDGYLIR